MTRLRQFDIDLTLILKINKEIGRNSKRFYIGCFVEAGGIEIEIARVDVVVIILVKKVYDRHSYFNLNFLNPEIVIGCNIYSPEIRQPVVCEFGC